MRGRLGEPVRTVAADDRVEPRCAADRVGGQQPGGDGRFDATGVEPVAGPVAGQHQVVEAGLAGAEPVLDRPGEREPVALGRGAVGAPVLRGQARLLPGSRSAAGERVAQRGARRGVRRTAPDQLCLRVEHAFEIAPRGRVGFALRRELSVGEHAAEVGHVLHILAVPPLLARQQMGHVAVGVERLEEAAHERLRVKRLAEVARAARQPQLRGLSDDGVRVAEHLGVGLADIAQLGADLALDVGWHREHHTIEVLAGLERGARAMDGEGVDLVLEASSDGRPCAAQLREAGPTAARTTTPRRCSRRCRTRPLAAARSDPAGHLFDDLDLGDAVAVGAGPKGRGGVEEAHRDLGVASSLRRSSAS